MAGTLEEAVVLRRSVSVTGVPETSAAEAVTADGVRGGASPDASPAAVVSEDASTTAAAAAGVVTVEGATIPDRGPDAVAVAVEVSVSAGRVSAVPADACLSTDSFASTSASAAGGGGGSAVSMPVSNGGSMGGALGEIGVMTIE